jgi:hypothetical protein
MKWWLLAALTAVVAAQAPEQMQLQTQPLPYSHKKHLAIQLKCQDCHTNPDPGQQMMFPATAKCMSCHVSVAKDLPAIQKLAQYAKSGDPIPWVRVYSAGAGVYWSHRSHLQAGATCERCHGAVAQMDVMTKVTNVTTMEGCVACHRENRAPTGCEFCHEGR